MGSDRSEHIQSFPDESKPEGNDECNSTSQLDKKDENNKKETVDEEDSSSSDTPDQEVRLDRTEDTTKENHKSIADEQIKEKIQDSQDSQEDGCKNLPPTPENSGGSLGQGMDDSLQLVSLVCHIQIGMSGV